jgi:hypothetical protein
MLTEMESDYRNLSQIDPLHPLVTDLAEKDRLFDEAASKFAITA